MLAWCALQIDRNGSILDEGTNRTTDEGSDCAKLQVADEARWTTRINALTFGRYITPHSSQRKDLRFTNMDGKRTLTASEFRDQEPRFGNSWLRIHPSNNAKVGIKNST